MNEPRDGVETRMPMPMPRGSALSVEQLQVSHAADHSADHSADADPLRAASLLIVGVNYAPEAIGVAPRTTSMARNLAATAERVTVLTGVPHHPVGFLPLIYRGLRRSYGQEAGVHLVRHRHHVPSGQSILGQRLGDLVGQVRYETSFLRAVLRTPIPTAPHLVIGVTPSVGGAYAAGRIAHRFGVPLLIVVQDLVAAHPHTGGPVRATLARYEGLALRRATRVVIVSEELRAGVLAHGVAANRIDVLANWSLKAPLSLGQAAARARLGWPTEGFVVVHTGNMGSSQDAPTLVGAARRIAGRGEDVQFVLVGEGSQRKAQQLAARDLPGVRFLDPVTARDYPVLLAAADVLLLNERPGRPDRTLVSKLHSYVMAGRPIIAAINPEGDADRALRVVASAAVTVLPGDDQALATVVARLRDAPQERERMSAAARKYAETAQPGTAAAQKLRDVVRATLVSLPRQPGQPSQPGHPRSSAQSRR
jgi:glycosyltransferase involved in cell wall biosynthesis